MEMIVFGFLWFVVLPIILHFAVYRGGGLETVWTILPYFLQYNASDISLSYLASDWEAIGRDIYDRTHGENSVKVSLTSEESAHLLSSPDDDDTA